MNHAAAAWLLAFAALVLAFTTIGELVVERRRVFRSLRTARNADIGVSIANKELAVPFMQRVGGPVLRRIGGLARGFAPASVLDRLDRDLTYAGIQGRWDAERVLALKALSTVGIPLVIFILLKMAGLAVQRAIVASMIFAFIGYYLPEWILRSKVGKRQAEIQRALPDALDLLSITVEAGLAFDAATQRVARHSGGPLGEELSRVLKEIQLGKSRSDALRDFGERTTVAELRSFVLAVIQADVFGISIAKVLHHQAAEMRTKRRQRAEEKAQKLQVKILMPLLSCIFPALFVVLLGPAAINIYQSFIKS